MKNLIILLFLLLGLTQVEGKQDSLKFHNASEIEIKGLKALVIDSVTTVYIKHQISEMKIADPELAKVLGGLNKEDLLYLYNTGQIFDWSSQRYRLLIFGDSVGKFEKPSNKNGLLFSKTEHFSKTPAVDKAKGIFYSKIVDSTIPDSNSVGDLDDYDLNFTFLGFIFYFLMVIYGFRHLCRKINDPTRYKSLASDDKICSWILGAVSVLLFICGVLFSSDIGWNIWWSIFMLFILIFRLIIKYKSDQLPAGLGKYYNAWYSRLGYCIEVFLIFSMLFLASGMAMISIVYIVLTFTAMILSSYKLSGKTFASWAWG